MKCNDSRNRTSAWTKETSIVATKKKSTHKMPDGTVMAGAKHKSSSKGPCWDDYKMAGTKRGKTGKTVPNCVPVKKKK